jgi:hypothetical protein
MAKIKHNFVLKRPGEEDRLYSWQTRAADTDGFFQWNGSTWTLLQELEGTDLKYDACSMQGNVYFVDGKHQIIKYDPDGNEICVPDPVAPVVQYIINYQERLVGAGDARTEAEVIADGGVWPADSNRNRVLFSETLDDTTWSPNNFIDAESGSGEIISGLGVNSLNSATKGAQTQLVVFKPSSTLINDGVLGSADQKLNIASVVLGCPGYHSIVNTPFGLMWTAYETVCLMDNSGKEPNQVGFLINPAIKAIPFEFAEWSAAILHDNTYKLSIVTGSGAEEEEDDEIYHEEWWLDLRPQLFPNETNWYGPHTGDSIYQYSLFQTLLVGAQDQTVIMWELDVEGQFDSMSTTDARTSTMIWPRFKVENLEKAKLDAYGFRGESGVTTVDFLEVISYDNDALTTSNTISVVGNSTIYNVTRPLRRTSYDAQVTISHDDNADIEIHSLYLRMRGVRRQSEKGSSVTQT